MMYFDTNMVNDIFYGAVSIRKGRTNDLFENLCGCACACACACALRYENLNLLIYDLPE